jgi:hypothetical protein
MVLRSRKKSIMTLNSKSTEGKALGKKPAISHPKMLQAANFYTEAAAVIKPPDVFNAFKSKAPFPLRHFSNNRRGSCTRASQAFAQLADERQEQHRTILLTDEEVERVYFLMEEKYYGGGDQGAFEIDALSCWRKEDMTFKDTKGRPYTIDAFTRINHTSIEEIKKALFIMANHMIKLCFNLPAAWQTTNVWDIPEGQSLTGIWEPGSWGGHSMTAKAVYDTWGIRGVFSTWAEPDTQVSWRGIMAYCDEAHNFIDSINSWKKMKSVNKLIDLSNLKAEVNKISSVHIA